MDEEKGRSLAGWQRLPGEPDAQVSINKIESQNVKRPDFTHNLSFEAQLGEPFLDLFSSVFSSLFSLHLLENRCLRQQNRHLSSQPGT